MRTPFELRLVCVSVTIGGAVVAMFPCPSVVVTQRVVDRVDLAIKEVSTRIPIK